LTIVEKIIQAHCDKKKVSPGEFVSVKVDLVMATDCTGPLAIKQFRRIGVDKVFDPSKIVLIPDHFVPNKDLASAEQARQLREFACEQGTRYFELGQGGIAHVLMPEKGLIFPGDIVVGADSHTCTGGALGTLSTGMGSTDIAYAMATGEIWLKVPPTIKIAYRGKLSRWVSGKDLILYTIGDMGVDGALYSAMEFCGEGIDSLSMSSRFTMANMAVEAGAKTGIMNVDRKTRDFINQFPPRPYAVYTTDNDAEYARIIEYDVSSLEPQVSAPHSPANSGPVSRFDNIEVDQVFIGSCTNGHLEDLRVAGQILKGRRVHPRVRCLIIPATQKIYLEALSEGLIELFLRAGALVGPPVCGPCPGACLGVLAAGERCLSTTNRNFIGRMGSPQSEVYLANPAVAAATAITGRISGPEEVAKK
jgi:3-isopropylmalate/(R)-2-methylmalate dehydratase large subunit